MRTTICALFFAASATACAASTAEPADMPEGPDAAAVTSPDSAPPGPDAAAPDAAPTGPAKGDAAPDSQALKADGGADSAPAMATPDARPDGRDGAASALPDAAPTGADGADVGAVRVYTISQLQFHDEAVRATFPQACVDADRKCGGVARSIYGFDTVPMVCVAGHWRLALSPVIGSDLWTFAFECEYCPVHQLCVP